MSHAISIHSIEEHIFLLNQLATSSPIYVGELRANFVYEKADEWICSEFDYEFIRYQGQLASLVSDYLIQCATRTRIIQDSCKVEWDEGYDPDKEAYEKFSEVANLIEGRVNFSIREICNKIIHTTKFELEYVDLDQEGFKYWSGKCHLHGSQNGKPWHVELNTIKWGFALQHYYDVRE